MPEQPTREACISLPKALERMHKHQHKHKLLHKHKYVRFTGMPSILTAAILCTLCTLSLSSTPACRTVLVGHEYAPQRQLHGADTRLLQVLSTLAEECDRVVFVSFTHVLQEQCWEPWELRRELE